MASQVLPRAGLPRMSKTCSSRSMWPSDLLEVLLEAGLEIGRGRGLRHLRQRFHDLLFGVVDVLEGIEEEVVEGLFFSHLVRSVRR